MYEDDELSTVIGYFNLCAIQEETKIQEEPQIQEVTKIKDEITKYIIENKIVNCGDFNFDLPWCCCGKPISVRCNSEYKFKNCENNVAYLLHRMYLNIKSTKINEKIYDHKITNIDSKKYKLIIFDVDINSTKFNIEFIINSDTKFSHSLFYPPKIETTKEYDFKSVPIETLINITQEYINKDSESLEDYNKYECDILKEMKYKIENFINIVVTDRITFEKQYRLTIKDNICKLNYGNGKTGLISKYNLEKKVFEADKCKFWNNPKCNVISCKINNKIELVQ